MYEIWCAECFVCEYRHWPMGDRVWCDECCLWIQTLTNENRVYVTSVVCYSDTMWDRVWCDECCLESHDLRDRVWCDECCLWIQTLTNERPCLMWRVLSVNTDTDQGTVSCDSVGLNTDTPIRVMWPLWIQTLTNESPCLCDELLLWIHWPMGDRVWLTSVLFVNTDTDQWETVLL